ncbi:ABC transporter permease subunit [Kitasatospora sp. NPDC101157]|uniref:ABC transporter permease subunit n=1 Tax=Kitasatospora sp. NPDC101157 TaxID=3364098 RepID=UPI003827B41B
MVTRIGALALADFRERRRRPGYLVVLLGTLALGLLAAPVGDSRWEVFQVTDLHGRYTSGYVGTVTALGGAVWLSLAGFGIARGTIGRDERSGVGRLLAATPLSRIGYLAGKFVSHLLLFGSMLLALAGTALAVQLIKGDSDRVDAVRLLLPYVLITLPLLAAVAGCAVLFDTVPGLRGGLGAAVWFAVWLVLVLGAQAGGGPDLLGMQRITTSIRQVLTAGGRPVDGVEFGVGLTADNRVLGTFDWPGLGLGEASGPAATGVLLAGAAVGTALLGALWFRRFDGPQAHPDAGPLGSLRPFGSFGAARPTGSTDPTGSDGPAGGAAASSAGPAGFALDPTRLTAPRQGRIGYDALLGELRILVRGQRLWWAGVVVLAMAAAAVAPDGPSHAVLPFAMLWPLALWSRMGHRADGGSIDQLLDACPSPLRRGLAGLLAGIVPALAVAAVPALRLVGAGQARAAAGALAGALLIPALALLCGGLTRGPRLFQTVYPLLWYGMINHVSGLDFLGVSGDRAPAPPAVAGLAAALAAAALALDAIRHAAR